MAKLNQEHEKSKSAELGRFGVWRLLTIFQPSGSSISVRSLHRTKEGALKWEKEMQDTIDDALHGNEENIKLVPGGNDDYLTHVLFVSDKGVETALQEGSFANVPRQQIAVYVFAGDDVYSDEPEQVESQAA